MTAFHNTWYFTKCCTYLLNLGKGTLTKTIFLVSIIKEVFIPFFSFLPGEKEVGNE